MATQISPKPGKHDAFITGQLDRAGKRIRFVDFATGVAGLVAGTILFAVAVALLDRAFGLSAGTRQTFLLFYLLGAAAYGYLAILRPMRWRVNPLYAARQIERAMPGTRNHLVNWVDLRDEKLPGVLRSSLGQRTAKDLGKVDVEEAISNRRAWVAAGGVGVMGVVLVALVLVFGPRLFGSLLARAFVPFGSGGVPPRTRISLERPAGGNVVATIGDPVTVVARIEGRVPAPRDRDAPCLLYRADDSEPWRKRHLQHDDGGEWVATVGAVDVGNGFTYKLTAGDAETAEYRVTTRAAPLIADFLATYHYRPYVGRAGRSRTARKLEELRGTEVRILARTNRVLEEAWLVFETAAGGGERVKAELRADDPKAMRFRFVLARPGKYKLKFTSAEGEKYVDSVAHDVVVLPDEAPAVRMTRPDKDVDAPADGQVDVRGEIADDIGVASVSLRLKVAGGPALAAVPYLADRLGKADFGTPRNLEYRELLELASLRDEAGKPFEAKPGLVLECWLEARDGCDFPHPNAGESKPRRLIRITPSRADAAQKAEQEKARREKKAADEKQEDDLKKQKADAEKRKEQEAADEKEAAREREQAGKQEGGKGNKPEEQAAKDGETERKAAELKNKIEEREQEQGKGPGEQKPGEGKGEGGQKEDRPGAGRDEGTKDEKSAPGEKKEPGKGDPGQARDGGKPEKNEAKGESKPGGENKTGDKHGEGKPDQGKPGKEGAGKGPGEEKAGKPGEGKPEGTPPADKKPGEAKDSWAARMPEKGGDRPSEVKAGAGKGGKKGEAKPGGTKGGSDNKGDTRGGPKPEDATAQDARDRADDLKRGGEEDRQAAARDLKDIAGRAKDEDARQAAEEALAKAREEFAEPGGPPGAKPEDATGDDVKRLGAKARGGSPDEKAAARGQLGDIAKKAKDADARKGARDELDKAWQEWLNSAPDRPRRRERAAKSRPSALQLEEFRKKVDPNILKDMKMSKEQFEQFLRDYADLADRTPASPEDDDKPVGVGQAGGTLPTLGGKTIQPGKGANDPRGASRAKPPPEYRDARDELLRRLNLPR